MTDPISPAQAKANRPLSPHLQIYRPQITSVLSILHRATGLALIVGTLALVCWLGAAAKGESAYTALQGFWGTPVGMILLMGWSWALYFHLCGGIRHLVFSAARGFDLPDIYKSGWLMVFASTLLTAATWYAAFVV